MNKLFLSRSVRVSIAAACGLGLAALTTGCGSGILASDEVTAGTSVGLSGMVHGGPSPIAGGKLTLYATGTTGYGSAATVLNTTTPDANGNFAFPAGGAACPAGQYGYIVSQGGNAGGFSTNGSIVLVAALGPCSTVTATRVVLINELTTVVAAYTLANFTSITGTAPFFTGGTLNSNTFTVNIGAPTTNNASAGCAGVSGYPNSCGSTTASAGLKHAFANAAMIIDTSDAYLTPGTSNGASVPITFINTLANAIQACVNSNGGGYNKGSAGTAGDGTATTTTTAAGASHDGTACGKLFAFTSYTNSGLVPGTNTTNGAGTAVTTALVNASASGTNGTVPGAPTNTLQALLNLAKRPNGSAATFNSTCDSNSAPGTSTAANCIFGLTSSSAFYQPSLSAAPNDWVFGIQYAKNAFSNTSYTGATPSCSSGTSPNVINFVPATNGVLYPYDVKTDVDDNITLLNLDSSNNTCFNLITARFDGTPISAGPFDTSTAKPIEIANDAYGHTVVPEASGNQINIYTTGTDVITGTPLLSVLPLNSGTTTGQVAGTPRANATTAATTATFVAVDNNSDFLVGAITAPTSELGYCLKGTGFSHATVTYNCSEPISTTSTFSASKATHFAFDPNNNVSYLASSGSNLKFVYIPSGYTNFLTNASITGAGGTTGGNAIVMDNSIASSPGHIYNYSGNASPSTADFISVASYTATTIANATLQYTPPTTNLDTKIANGVIDGNQVLFSANSVGTAATVTGSLRFYDTVNNYFSPQIFGCKTGNVNTTTCGQIATDSNQSFLFYGTRNFAVDAAGSLWVANPSNNTLTEVFGLAAPTLPTYIHNGVSNKP